PRRVRIPAGWPIGRDAWACLGRGSRMCERMVDPRLARQGSENRGETRFLRHRPGDLPWPQGPGATGPVRPGGPLAGAFADLGISPASYCRGALRARNMRISQEREVALSAPWTVTPPGERDRAEEGRRE